MAEKVELAATPTLRTGNRRGFTTIELMVTLALMALISGLVVVSMAPALREARIRTGCRIVASALVYARSYAVTHHTNTLVVLDTTQGAVAVYCQAINERGEQGLRPVLTTPGRRHALPQGIAIARIEKPGTEEEETYVSFSQLGRSEDVAITIKGTEGKERLVVVDAITGRCAIRSSEKL